MRTTLAEKPHLGEAGLPFMYRNTGWLLTSELMIPLASDELSESPVPADGFDRAEKSEWLPSDDTRDSTEALEADEKQRLEEWVDGVKEREERRKDVPAA